MSRFLSPGTLTILILAILVGLVAAYGIRGALVRPPAAPPGLPQTSSVPLASAGLPAGRRIVEGDIVLMPMTREEMNAQPWAASLHRVMLFTNQVIGRTLQKPIAEGQPFMTSDFYLQGGGPDLLTYLKPGYRLVGLQVPFERGGYVNPPTMVDVLFRSAYRAATEISAEIPEKTVVLVQNVEVIAADRPISDPGDGPASTQGINLTNRRAQTDAPPPTILIAVTPEQANEIEAVRNHGEFTLVSRSPTESGFDAPPSSKSLEDVLGIDTMLVPEGQLPSFTEIYRAGQRQVNSFQPSGNRYVPISASGNP